MRMVNAFFAMGYMRGRISEAFSADESDRMYRIVSGQELQISDGK
jgi:hypothetical protein